MNKKRLSNGPLHGPSPNGSSICLLNFVLPCWYLGWAGYTSKAAPMSFGFELPSPCNKVSLGTKYVLLALELAAWLLSDGIS